MRILGVSSILLAAGLAFASLPATAAETAAPTAAAPAAAAAAAPAAAAPTDPLLSEDGAPPMKTIEAQSKPGDVVIGEPHDKIIAIQEQVTPNGQEALGFHNWILFPLITIISLFVLFLLLWAMVRYRRSANPTPSRTSHNTLIEIIWTGVPVLILVAIAIPSIRLLAHQFKPAPDNAITLKATGNQWFWTYEYPDLGINLTANMLKEKDGDDAAPAGTRYRTDVDGPRLLAADTRIVLPTNTPIRLLTTGSDVIHSWAIPAFWIKLDAVPGKINETSFTIQKPGLYFGQCSELCGKRHGFMPIVVEAVDPKTFAAWVKAKGGTFPSAKPAAAAAALAAAPAPATANAAAPVTNEAEPANAAAGNAE
jgi:cytochrome c oxidase subunit 2